MRKILRWIFKQLFIQVIRMGKQMPDVDLKFSTLEKQLVIFKDYDALNNIVTLPEGEYPGINYLDESGLVTVDQVDNPASPEQYPFNDRYYLTAGSNTGKTSIMIYGMVTFNITVTAAQVTVGDIDRVEVTVMPPEPK